MYCALDLVDGYYQLLMQAIDIPLTAVSTPSSMLWEWMVDFIGTRGLRVDPDKVKAIVNWPVPKNQKDLRKWLGLANHLHKYSESYAEMGRPVTDLLKKDIDWRWDTHADAFRARKESLLHAPILALPNPEYPFSVVCGASYFAVGRALLQTDAAGRERVITFESR